MLLYLNGDKQSNTIILGNSNPPHPLVWRWTNQKQIHGEHRAGLSHRSNVPD